MKKPVLISDIPLTFAQEEAAIAGVMNGPDIDFRGEFSAPGSGQDTWKVAKILLKENGGIDFPDLEPHAWSKDGFPFDPCILVEDTEGRVSDLRSCSPATETEQDYGAVCLDDEGGLWLIRKAAPVTDLMTAADVRTGNYVPVRLHGQDANAIDQIGSVYDIEGPCDGEFMISVEDKPVLVGCPWWSEIGSYAPGFGSEGDRKAAEDLAQAIRESVAAALEAEKNDGPEL